MVTVANYTISNDMPTKLDNKIINLISRDIPLVKEPFNVLAAKLGIEQKVLLKRINAYKKQGLMRKFCASLNHKKIGINSNAMVVWNVPARSVQKAGKIMSLVPQVSHCYQRRKAHLWNYNLYTMIHGRNKKECFTVISDISNKTGCKDDKILFSSKEYKKTPAQY